ncbi:MAG: ECF transporter S component [Ruminococcaceae bacterium]|nr:ECF transporter S component [Oscillospiraceae bacterium]
MQTKRKNISTKTLTLGAVLTALVILLQMAGAFIKFGQFSISLVLIPIVIGAATCGVGVGGWLGFVFSLVVLLSGDAAPFLAVHVPGTILTVIAKGTLCGLCAGLVYRGVLKLCHKEYVAVLAAAFVCPVVNTGVFLLGCIVFFMDTLAVWGQGLGFQNVWKYMLIVLVGFNFLFELGTNLLLSPLVVRLLTFRKKQ